MTNEQERALQKEKERAERLSAEIARLDGSVQRFAGLARRGEVKAMLLEALTIQDAVERVAKVVTRTEVMP